MLHQRMSPVPACFDAAQRILCRRPMAATYQQQQRHSRPSCSHLRRLCQFAAIDESRQTQINWVHAAAVQAQRTVRRSRPARRKRTVYNDFRGSRWRPQHSQQFVLTQVSTQVSQTDWQRWGPVCRSNERRRVAAQHRETVQRYQRRVSRPARLHDPLRRVR